MIEIQYDSRSITEALQRLQGATSELLPVMQAIGVYMQGSTKLNFSEQHDPFGNTWEPLQQSTLNRRKKKGAGAQILRDTGRLMNSISYQADSSQVAIGPDGVIYAATHQFGDIARNIPARPFLGVSDADEQEILSIIQQHIEDALK